MSEDLDPRLIEATLRRYISELDYDTHKYLECDEETGSDTYPEQAAVFIEIYNNKRIVSRKETK